MGSAIGYATLCTCQWMFLVFSVFNCDVMFCRVISDPQSEVAWFFKGSRINATLEPRPEEGDDGRQASLSRKSLPSLSVKVARWQILQRNIAEPLSRSPKGQTHTI